MKKYLLLFSLMCTLLFSVQYAFPFSDVATHPQITEKATAQSILASDYLTNNLGFKKGLEEIILTTKNIQKLLAESAHTEDTGTDKGVAFCKRGLNHFYDPTKYGAGLDETVDFSISIGGIVSAIHGHYQGKPNLLWATSDYYDPAFSTTEPTKSLSQ